LQQYDAWDKSCTIGWPRAALYARQKLPLCLGAAASQPEKQQAQPKEKADPHLYKQSHSKRYAHSPANQFPFARYPLIVTAYPFPTSPSLGEESLQFPAWNGEG